MNLRLMHEYINILLCRNNSKINDMGYFVFYLGSNHDMKNPGFLFSPFEEKI